MLIGMAASATVPYVASRFATAVTSIPCAFSALPSYCRGVQPLPRADRFIGRRGRRALRLILERRFEAPHIRLHRAFNMSEFAEYQSSFLVLVGGGGGGGGRGGAGGGRAAGGAGGLEV